MATNSNQNNPQADEIDLITLFLKIGEALKKGILWLINFIGSILVFLLRKWYYFGVAVLLTIVSAYILNNISDPYFHSEMVIRSNATHNQPIMSCVNKLGEYANAGNYPALASNLNLSVEEVSAIKDINTFWIYDIGGDGIFDGIDKEERFLSDTSVVTIDSVFIVYAAVYNPEILEKLEESMVLYLEANPFLEALNKQRLSTLKASLIQTEYEIVKLDSLQRREYYTDTDQLRQKEGQIVFTSEKTVRIYHNDMFSLLKWKQDYERDLNIYSDVVTIVEGFSTPLKPDNGANKYLKSLIWYYLGLALFLAVVVSFRKNIWIREDPK